MSNSSGRECEVWRAQVNCNRRPACKLRVIWIFINAEWWDRDLCSILTYMKILPEPFISFTLSSIRHVGSSDTDVKRHENVVASTLQAQLKLALFSNFVWQTKQVESRSHNSLLDLILPVGFVRMSLLMKQNLHATFVSCLSIRYAATTYLLSHSHIQMWI